MEEDCKEEQNLKDNVLKINSKESTEAEKKEKFTIIQLLQRQKRNGEDEEKNIKRTKTLFQEIKKQGQKIRKNLRK